MEPLFLYILSILEGIIAMIMSVIWSKVNSLEKGERSASERLIALETELSITLRRIEATLKDHTESLLYLEVQAGVHEVIKSGQTSG